MPTDSCSDWILPDWPAPPWVGAVFTTRAGGVSQPPFDSCNLGDHVQDDAAAVAQNRALLAQRSGVEPGFLQQVHGVQVVDAGQAQGCAPQADACFTQQPGVGCTVMVADCLPVLLVHRRFPIVGAAHAGWRGLADGVIEQLHARMRQTLAEQGRAQDAGGDWLAWLGPCIGPTAFEVGGEVRATFLRHDAAAAAAFQPAGRQGKWLADLPLLARQRLQTMGIGAIHGNDGSLPWCTFSQEERFFSYRRQPRTGRMAAMVWIRG